MPKFELSDPYFVCNTIAAQPNPNQIVYAGMHQDYSSHLVSSNQADWPSERECGEIITRRLLKVGHYGCLEHPQLVVNFGYFPHSVMQQLRTHRNLSFDVQSFRYTSKNISYVAAGIMDPEEAFYLRPLGKYRDRNGKCYEYKEHHRMIDKHTAYEASEVYTDRLEQGFSEEHARGMLPFDIRQHFVLSGNARSILHLLDVRGNADVQLECQAAMHLLFAEFQKWMPEVAEWYEKNRWQKGRLAP